MGQYFTKKQLYSVVHSYKRGLGLFSDDYGFNMIDLCQHDGVLLAQIPFKTKHLRGMAAIGDTKDKDVILLNSNRTLAEQNFDCSHEYIHLCIHRRLNKKVFNCLDAIYVKQDEYIEWQANEGAAELLIPYMAFLPMIKSIIYDYQNPYLIQNFKKQAAATFNVTTRVIEYRLESLKYEIHQYLNGIPIDKIKMLSLSQQKRKRINIKSLNEIEKELLTQKYNELSGSNFINFGSL